MAYNFITLKSDNLKNVGYNVIPPTPSIIIYFTIIGSTIRTNVK